VWTGKEAQPIMRPPLEVGEGAMSTDLFRVRIFFDAHIQSTRKGIAKSDEMEIQLSAAPDIPGLPKHITLLDYSPQVRCHEIRESASQRRDMTAAEIAAAEQWLSTILSAVRAAMRAAP